MNKQFLAMNNFDYYQNEQQNLETFNRISSLRRMLGQVD